MKHQGIGIFPALAGFAGGFAVDQHGGFSGVAEEAEEFLAFFKRRNDVLIDDALGAGFALCVEQIVVGGIAVAAEVTEREGRVHIVGAVFPGAFLRGEGERFRRVAAGEGLAFLVGSHLVALRDDCVVVAEADVEFAFPGVDVFNGVAAVFALKAEAVAGVAFFRDGVNGQSGLGRKGRHEGEKYQRYRVFFHDQLR